MNRRGAKILNTFIDALAWDEALDQIKKWAAGRESRYVCLCNVHSVVTASGDAGFRDVINAADMATPDGAPVAWMLGRLGFVGQARINGPDFMWRYCSLASQSGESIYLYGGTPQTLQLLEQRLLREFPGLKIAGSYAPPFRVLTEAEDGAVVERINASGAGVVWVCLGCPRQEMWMAAHRGRVSSVMIGVGAAFDYHAGSLRRAPLWMQRCGLEWLHRLFSEPRRLWRRYLITNTIFIYRASCQLVFGRSR